MPALNLLASGSRHDITVVELLDWTYRRQKADVVTAKTFQPPRSRRELDTGHGQWSGDGCAAMDRFGLLGAIIPSTGHLQRPALHDDAARIHDAMILLSEAEQHWAGIMLLYHYARHGGQPRRDALPPRPVPILTGPRRTPLVTWFRNHYVGRDGRTRRFSAQCCPLDYTPPPESADRIHEEYRLWFTGLCRLNATLATIPLSRWRVAGLGALPPPMKPDTTANSKKPPKVRTNP